MSEANAAQEELRQPPVPVIVTSFPEQPHKPLFKDSTRLISVAAFIFSVVTGLYAAYQSWQNNRQATLETVSKLIDQYYQGQEKLATLNPQTQQGYINLLQSELKAIASRAARNAIQIQGDVDVGSWLALAQINQNESNWKASAAAWNSALQNADEDYVYAFASRGLATVQVFQGKLADAKNSMDLAFKSVTTDDAQFKKLSSHSPAAYRASEAAVTQAYYLNIFRQGVTCPFISQYFDSALAMAGQASQLGAGDLTLLVRLLGIRLSLEPFRKQRAACAPVDPSWELSNDNCYFLGLILDSAAVGFSPLKGPIDKDSALAPLLLPLLGSDGCNIDSQSGFSCNWSENDESGTNTRSGSIIQIISNCKNLINVSKTSIKSDSPKRTTEIITIHSENRPAVDIIRQFVKSTSSRPGRWEISLVIVPAIF